MFDLQQVSISGCAGYRPSPDTGSIDWDGNSDLRTGHIGIQRFTEDERIEEVRAVAFEE